MWTDIQEELPIDGSTVWIRVGTNYGNPVLAEFTLSTQIFVCDDSGLIVPAYMVARWKEQ